MAWVKSNTEINELYIFQNMQIYEQVLNRA